MTVSRYTYSGNNVEASRAEITAYAAQVKTERKHIPDTINNAQDLSDSTDSSEESSLPNRWTFKDCVDRPMWNRKILEALGQLTDFVYPRIQRVSEKKNWPKHTYDIHEITQLLSWICMLTVSTKGEFTEVAVEVFRSAMKAWGKGRSARRRVLSKCYKLETTLGSRPLLVSQLDQEMLHLPPLHRRTASPQTMNS